MFSEMVIALSIFIATAMVAHLGIDELAANGLGSSLYFAMAGVTWGIITGVAILIAHAFGAKEPAVIGEVLAQSIWQALWLSVFAIAFILAAPYLLQWWGESPNVLSLVKKYMYPLTVGVPADLLGFTLQQFYMGISKPRYVLIMNLVILGVTAFFNYVLIFGKWGFPQLGIAGVSWGISIAMWVMLLVSMSFLFLDASLKPYLKYLNFKAFKVLKKLWILGWPLGCMFFIEIGGFAAAMMMVSRVSTDALAAYQMAIQYSMIVVSSVFGVSEAAIIMVGQVLGAKQFHRLLNIVFAVYLLTMGLALICAVLFYLEPVWFIAIDMDPQSALNRDVVLLGIHFFKITAIFILLESMRLMFIGVLRGMKDTKFTLYSSIIMFFLIGLPLGYYSGLYHHHGASAILWALCIGSLAGNILVVYRVFYHIRAYQQVEIAHA